jgi:hypothetical protein
MDCLSASGNAVSCADDFCLAMADSRLLKQPNGVARGLEPHLRRDEEGFPGAFDAHRDLMCQTAAEVHSRDRKSRYELVGADFR